LTQREDRRDPWGEGGERKKGNNLQRKSTWTAGGSPIKPDKEEENGIGLLDY